MEKGGIMEPAFYQGITDFIFVKHSPEKADLIFVPGGNYPEAAEYAAELYHQGFAPRILPSGKYSIQIGRFVGGYDTEWDYLKEILRREGVPEQAILKEDQATYTYENAVRSREVLERLGILPKRAILVCQAFHARRCLMYYQEQFPDTRLMVCPVVTRDIRRDNWYLDRDKIDVVLGEVERCGTQFRQILYDGIAGRKAGEQTEDSGGWDDKINCDRSGRDAGPGGDAGSESGSTGCDP